MILKRKQERLARVGDFCQIKTSTLIKMVDSDVYRKDSLVCIKELTDSHITRSDLRKDRHSNNKLLLADSELLFIGQKSPFGNDLVEVIPLSMKSDRYKMGIRSLFLKTPKKYTMRAGSLKLANSDVLEGFKSSVISEYIVKKIRCSHGWQIAY